MEWFCSLWFVVLESEWHFFGGVDQCRSSTTYIIGIWCVQFCCGFVFALVGGAWPNSSLYGLWCWIVHNISSNTWESNGARLLMCRDLMCRFRCWLYALVGGRFADLSLCCGLWYWTLSYLSSNTHAHIGARLLICRDLMCKFRCCLWSCRRLLCWHF